MSIPAIDINKLSPEERLALIAELWDSLRAETDTVPVPPAHQKELDRRLDELDSGEAAAIPWDDVRRQLGQLEILRSLGLERRTSAEETHDGVGESEDGALRAQEGQGLRGQDAYQRTQHENELLRVLVRGDAEAVAGHGRDAEEVIAETRALLESE